MLTLLNLLSAVTLLIWGTHIVRTGILRVYGSPLRRVLSQNMSKRPLAFISGILVTALVQSSNATAMLVTSFVGQRLMALTPALAIMLGADVGTALMARVLTFDLSWLSPLLIFLGVILFLSRKQTRAGQLGRVGIGLGLIILALQLIVTSAAPITHAAGVKVLFASLTGDIMLDALIGAMFALISYSSLAAVLLTATLAGSDIISLPVAIGVVVGANIGSGLLAFLSTSMQNVAGRQVALGSLLYKLIGLLLIIPVLSPLVAWMDSLDYSPQSLVISFHVSYNTLRCLLMLPSVGPMARLCAWLLPERPETSGVAKPRHLDTTALVTPSLALANAVRETLRLRRAGQPALGRNYRAGNQP
jgi:phosphate:Na+ symporter